ncbi:MAG: czcB 1 [Acidobacteria bacterium]|nr:czcB 1 [Acidobacteriota bacterium]
MRLDVHDEKGRAALMAVLAAASLAVLAIGWLALRPRDAKPAPAAQALPAGVVELTDAAMKEAGLKVEPASTQEVQDAIEAPGVIALDERRTARIGSQVEGKVLEVFVEIGDRVPAGRELAHMISPVVHDAWAAYRKAVSERRRAETELKLAVQNEERAQRLFREKAASQQEVQRAAADRVAAEEGLSIVNTEVRRAQEEMEHLGITNSEDPTGEEGEQIPVRAPLAGVVLEKLITEGSAATPGMPLFVVSDLSTLWALAEVDETALPHVRAGQSAGVRVAAYPDETFAGTVAWVSDMVNPKTRRVTVRCAVPNPESRLKPDMYATIALGQGRPHPVVVLPSEAVQDIDGTAAVFVHAGGGRFTRRDVEAGAEREGRTEIRSGLRAGERVVVAGAFLLKSELLKTSAPEE